MRTVSIAGAAMVILLAALCSARPDDVPALNVDPVCHGIAQQAGSAGEKGGPDLAFTQCVKNEEAMRTRLVSEWPTFTPPERSNCANEETSVSLPSYTDLVTCLEMARTARQLNGPAPAR
jgi:hypothetical protein